MIWTSKMAKWPCVKWYPLEWPLVFVENKLLICDLGKMISHLFKS